MKNMQSEKKEIAFADKERNLNKRKELIYMCSNLRKLFFKT